jgi:Inositol hexakisphosphate
MFPPPSADATFAPLVLDTDEPALRRYRGSNALPDLTGLTTTGLDVLCWSASAQLSELGFASLRAQLSHVPPELFYVVDLRQESHGFLNGIAVSWYARNNWGCTGLSPDDAIALERLRLRLLALADTASVARSDDVKRGVAAAPVEIRPERVADEEHLLALPPGHYVRLPVTDHARPTDDVVDRFVRLVDALDPRAHVHFHCRGGKGRTTMFCIVYDLLRGAGQLPLAAVLDRHERIHDYDIRRIPPSTAAKAPFAQPRLDLLRDLHRFAQLRRSGDSWLDHVARR